VPYLYTHVLHVSNPPSLGEGKMSNDEAVKSYEECLKEIQELEQDPNYDNWGHKIDQMSF